MTYYCLICDAPVKNYEPVYCCTQKDCGCMGAPTNPCVCSGECEDALFTHSGTMDERAIAANIEKHVERTIFRIYAVNCCMCDNELVNCDGDFAGDDWYCSACHQMFLIGFKKGGS